MPSRNEAERFVVADRAIARLDTLIARWRTEGDGAPEDIRRARLDRILAYHARFRMRDAVAEYESLRAQGVTVPPYVLAGVASAYLYLRQPAIARDQIGRAHVCTPVTNAHLVCRLLLDKKKP